MSVSPDQLMSMISGQQSPNSGSMPGSSPPSQGQSDMGMSDSQTPPMSAPMSTPEPKMGRKEDGLIKISMASDLLEQALPDIGSETTEGQKILSSLRLLSGVLGPRRENVKELQNAEILQMLQTLPQAGGATPQGMAMSKAPIPGTQPAGGGAPPPVSQPTPM